jgi:chemotaxis-related protein WspD
MMNNQDLTTNGLNSTFNDCWNQIGVTGDRSCQELNSYMHCHNCPVYSAAGRGLLEREVPPEYLKQWTEILSETSTPQVEEKTKVALVGTSEVISLIIFRIGVELFSIPVRLLQEVTPTCVIHTLPHHTNELFLGLVNIRGETLLCVSLSPLLGLTEELSNTSNNITPVTSRRMVVVGKDENRWVFPVDEVLGIYRFHLKDLKEAPVVVTKASEAYTKGVISWQNKKVNYLDFELLFYTLKRRILEN